MSRLAYFNLRIPAPRRLEMMRADFANHATKYPYCPESCKPKTWRNVRAHTHGNWAAAFCTLSQGLNDGRPVWYSHAGAEFRRERYCDEIINIRHTGWFTDGESETARGIVVRLSHGRSIAGYHLSMNGERVYFPEVFDDECDAARMADEHARIIGEHESEYHARWDAAQQLETKINVNLQRLRECIALRHRACMDYLRDEITQLIESIRDDRETLETEFKGVL